MTNTTSGAAESAMGEAVASLTFIGTATTVLRLGGFTLLTDPNFLHRGERAYLGYGLTSRRMTEPALDRVDVQSLDAVLLSHLHGDHFDRRARAALPPETPIATTRHAERRLRRRGFSAAVALDTWQAWTIEKNGERLRVTAVPARHGPVLVHRALPPVTGTIVELERDGRTVLRLYQTGDTLCGPFLRQIGERFSDIDVMVAHLGGTRIAGLLVTMDARHGADLVELVRPALTVPVHYDDYGVFKSPLSHFQHEMRARGLDAGLRVALRGETVPLSATSTL
jgi:L-ascorbate metabolism protein UlaG (beta-lactamase superfamily)